MLFLCVSSRASWFHFFSERSSPRIYFACVIFKGVNKHRSDRTQKGNTKEKISTPRYISMCSLSLCLCVFLFAKKRKFWYLGKGQWSFIRAPISVCPVMILFPFKYTNTHTLNLSLALALLSSLGCRLNREKPDLCFLPMFTYSTNFPLLIKIVLLMHVYNS